jgi:hypothetical protein
VNSAGEGDEATATAAPAAPPPPSDDNGGGNGNDDNQGNQGQQGQQGGGTTPTADAPQTLTTIDSAATTQINTAVSIAVAQAAAQAAATGESAAGTITPRFENVGEVSAAVLAAIDNAAGDNDVRIHFDTMLPGNIVDVRVYINPAEVTGTDNINVSGSTTNQMAQVTGNTFETFFANSIAVVALGQQGNFGMDVRIAARVDLSGMNTNRLYFYAYDAAANTYTRIMNPQHRVDANGFLHFTTPLGGSIVISDGPFSLRNAPAAARNQNNQGNQQGNQGDQNRQYRSSESTLYAIPQLAGSVAASIPSSLMSASMAEAIVEAPVLTTLDIRTERTNSTAVIAISAMLVMLTGAAIIWGVKTRKSGLQKEE